MTQQPKQLKEEGFTKLRGLEPHGRQSSSCFQYVPQVLDCSVTAFLAMTTQKIIGKTSKFKLRCLCVNRFVVPVGLFGR
jgi:hypothetical protein